MPHKFVTIFSIGFSLSFKELQWETLLLWDNSYVDVITLFTVYISVPPLSSGQSSWLQFRRSGFDSRLHQIFWEVLGIERRTLSFVVTIEELLGRNISDSGLESQEHCHGDPLCWPCDTLYPQKMAITAPTSIGRSVGIVRSRIKAAEFLFVYSLCIFSYEAQVC
jgi:hypothetical protein